MSKNKLYNNLTYIHACFIQYCALNWYGCKIEDAKHLTWLFDNEIRYTK